MADLIKMVMDRRAMLAAEQERLVAELAELDEIIRMAAILSAYDQGPRDGDDMPGPGFGMRIAGLASNGSIPWQRTGAEMRTDGLQDPSAIAGTGRASGTPWQPEPSHLARSALTTGFPELGDDHFEFNF